MKIPKIIHRVWIESDQPDWLRAYGQTWTDLHPGWIVKTWTDYEVPALFPLEGDTQELWDRADEYVDFGHLPQFRADILRYTLLYRFGGVAVDADFEALKPIDPLVDPITDMVISAWEVEGQWAVNGFLGAPPEHYFIQALILGLLANCEDHRHEAPTRMSGPQYLSNLMRRFKDEAIKEVVVYPTRFFFPYQPTAADVKRFPIGYTFTSEEFPDLYAVHVWRNKRRKMGLLEGME